MGITRTLHLGDCIETMNAMEENSVDSIVTDPPYELGFMGKSWDSTGIAFNTDVWRAALRVLKPGGHLLAFSGSRTYHRMAVAIEDAGFQIRDQIMWIYGSGFPKSLNISKAFDKAEGLLENEGTGMIPDGSPTMSMYPSIKSSEYESLEPPGFLAKQWQGWGTALKPAHEPLVLARKPLIGTVAENVLTYGTGGLNIDGTRVGYVDDKDYESVKKAVENLRESQQGTSFMASSGEGREANTTGRWPANVIHDGSDEVLELFGAPARFFYGAKANKRDRNEGLDGFEAIRVHDGRADGNKGGSNPRNRTNNKKINHHPTVKPTDLMRYLCRLITTRGGVILDPFMGSGSTGKACALEGFDFVGIEKEKDYFEIAKARIDWVNV